MCVWPAICQLLSLTGVHFDTLIRKTVGQAEREGAEGAQRERERERERESLLARERERERV